MHSLPVIETKSHRSHNEEREGTEIEINTITAITDIPPCMSAHDMQEAA